MSETRLVPTGPLGAGQTLPHRWTGFAIDAAPATTRWWIATRHGEAETVRTAFEAATGLSLPDPGRWNGAAGIAVFWAGPEQWFVECDANGPPAGVAVALGDSASAVELTDAWCGLVLDGPATPSVLSTLCMLDLHPTAFPPGRVARTLMAHQDVTIACLDEAPRFALWVNRSSARSFLEALVQAGDSRCGGE